MVLMPTRNSSASPTSALALHWLKSAFAITKMSKSNQSKANASGRRQSPIDLITSSVKYASKPGIYWGKGLFEEPITQEIIANNHTVVIRSTFSETPYITGGPLLACYKLDSVHFHWGQTNNRGSEHTLNGLSYPMEMHVVWTKGNLSTSEALVETDGVAVIGYFVDLLPEYLEKRKPKNPFSLLAKTMSRLQFVDVAKTMAQKFSMNNLIIPFKFNYITYEGSLTTPNYNEVVTWIIAPNVLKISRPQLQQFRSLYPRKLMSEAANYREVQPLNERHLYFVKGRRSVSEKGF